jgi:cytochrome P450
MPQYPPGPKAGFFGAGLARRFAREPLEFITEIGRTYGDMAYFRLGPIRAYFVNSPTILRDLLVTKNKNFQRPRWITRPLSKIDGNGLVLSDGEFWLRQRRLVQPAFSTKRFDGYARVTVDGTRRMLDRWSGAIRSTSPKK